MSRSLFVIELDYANPATAMAKIDENLSAHRDFLQTYYDRGLLLVSGPKIPREGGVIIACMESKEAVQAFIQADPFYQQGIAKYRVIEFDPVKSHDALAGFIG